MLDYMVSFYRDMPVSSDRLSDWLTGWLAQHQNWCHDPGFSASFPWRETGLPQRAFLQRELKINGHHYLTGPRYLGGDLAQPFIEIIARNGAVDHRVASAIMQAWRPLRPRQLRALLPVAHPASGSTDQLIFLSQPGSLSAGRAPDLSLQPAMRQDYAACMTAVEHAYRASWRALPQLRHQLLATSRRELRDDIARGDVFLIVWQGVLAGLMICVRRQVAFIDGFQIMDEVILPAYQGRGLAAQAQQHLLYQLYQQYGDQTLLTGTILPGNIPSVRTAQNAQRRCVLKYQFFTPADLRAARCAI
ncbi:N-acetyltransferase [Pantoea sp. C2G6]|uniref:N-acetyltransferase n=1 Tax=Pantoea sp. C2G6 TaxID=3243084 RepID=UPI003EDA0A62